MRHDDLYNVKWRELRGIAVGWIDTLERRTYKQGAFVVAATAVNLLLLCRNFGLDPRHVLETAERMLRRAELVEPMYPRGIAECIKNEFRADN